ncbi:thermonuclease family protein (plasmid) [Rhizobium sp. CB3171]|uniref:thermonuclease family protein n=1 Tax=Rhizobium sp. CB3171 TaxID=3039157 RepID=UPI0024B0FAA5|nr:thermonuclease family protein [Rhizobium sp. CB3171]WFU07187.1 thermonuclease family protein [Rhizobium sp. CB3171]
MPLVAQAQANSLGTAKAPNIYTPGDSMATNPMRVVVLSSTTFEDVEAKQTYRLYGIDACDMGQTATLGKQTWPCGVVAMAWLVSATLNKWVVCSPIRKDETIIVGRCATGEMADIASEMLKAGIAITLPDPPDRRIASYAQLERDARKSHRGIWASTFQMPYRKSSPPNL